MALCARQARSAGLACHPPGLRAGSDPVASGGVPDGQGRLTERRATHLLAPPISRSNPQARPHRDCALPEYLESPAAHRLSRRRKNRAWWSYRPCARCPTPSCHGCIAPNDHWFLHAAHRLAPIRRSATLKKACQPTAAEYHALRSNSDSLRIALPPPGRVQRRLQLPQQIEQLCLVLR